MKGWERGGRHSHRGDVPDSPGWSQEEKATVDRMWREIRELSIAVVAHPYWSTVAREEAVAARMVRKRQTRPAASSSEAA